MISGSLERRLPVGEVPWFSHRLAESPWKDAPNSEIDDLISKADYFGLQHFVQHDMRGYSRYTRAIRDEFAGLNPRTVNSETLNSYAQIAHSDPSPLN